MYGDGNQYQQFNNMPYDNTGAQQIAPQQETPQDPQAGGNGPAQPENKKKKDSVWRKLGVSAACALVFGCVAGVTMTGVTRMTGASASTTVISESAAAETEAAEQSGEVKAVPETAAETEAPKLAAETAAAESISPGAVLDVSAIVEKAMPSVVAIDVKGEQSYTSIFGYSQKYETEGAGSGILIGENDEEYLIVTNNHVVANTKSMSVQFIDGESVEAELKGTDSGKDVAVIAVKKEDVPEGTRAAIRIAEIGDSDNLKVGQGVIAIGNALGYGQSVTVGYVSALNRTITAMDSTGENARVENLLQTDAAINPGNSGGALLDMEGRVIGINESKSVDTTVEGMGYAIPISSVTELIDTLSTQKTRSKVAEENRGYLGIQGQNVDSDAAQRFSMPIGIFVYRILEGGAAADSELQESDIITKLDGMTVSTIEELQEKLAHYEKDETVTLTVQRPNGSEYQELSIEVKLASRDALDAASGGSQEETAPENNAEQQPEQGNDSGFGGLDAWEDFFRNGGFQFRW